MFYFMYVVCIIYIDYNLTYIQDQDSYVSFRSQGVNMSISFVTKPTTSDLPACLFYASTLRWMDKVKVILLVKVHLNAKSN